MSTLRTLRAEAPASEIMVVDSASTVGTSSAVMPAPSIAFPTHSATSWKVMLDIYVAGCARRSLVLLHPTAAPSSVAGSLPR